MTSEFPSRKINFIELSDVFMARSSYNVPFKCCLEMWMTHDQTHAYTFQIENGVHKGDCKSV